MAVDGAGNVTLVGYLRGSADFGGGVLTTAGGDDLFVAELTPSGGHLWSKRFGDASDQSHPVVAIDASGNNVVGAWLMGSVDFGGGPLTSAGSWDNAVAKLAP